MRRGKGTTIKNNNAKPSTQEVKTTTYSNSFFNWKTQIALLLFAFVLFLFHKHYNEKLFENLRWWSTRTWLQKHTSFYSEQAMYYRYFKKAVELPSIPDTLNFFMNDTRVQYPDAVNALRQFNVWPELFMGIIYRLFPFGEPIDFYVNIVHLLNGAYLSFVFLIGSGISCSFVGGVFSAICFMFNHGHVTRAWWSVSLRESIGTPFFFGQIFAVTYYLQMKHMNTLDKKMEKILLAIFSVNTFAFSISWQFAPFALLTQVTAFFILYLLGTVGRREFNSLVGLSGLSVLVSAIFQFGNQMLLNSLFFNIVIVTLALVNMFPDLIRPAFSDSWFWHILNLFRVLITTLVAAVLAVLLKLGTAKIFNITDDGHIFDIIRAKFTSFETFHTTLYLKQKEYQMIDEETVRELSVSLLLPSAAIVTIYVVSRLLIPGELKKLSPAVLYNWLQFLATTAMALLIMRLKVFWTPFACVVVSIMCSAQFREVFHALLKRIWSPKTKEFAFYIVLAALILGMSYSGVPKIKEQYYDEKEWDHKPLQSMMTWINDNTPKNAVFSGDMVDLSYVMLCTDRIVTNHPHYESEEIRNKTSAVYSLFTCKTPEEVYKTLKEYGTTHIVLNPRGCGKSSVLGATDKESCPHDREFCTTVQQATQFFSKVYDKDDNKIYQLK